MLTNYHEQWLKTTQVNYVTVLLVISLVQVSLGCHQGVGRAALLPGDFRGASISYPFSVSRCQIHSSVLGALLLSAKPATTGQVHFMLQFFSCFFFCPIFLCLTEAGKGFLLLGIDVIRLCPPA